MRYFEIAARRRYQPIQAFVGGGGGLACFPISTNRWIA
jgi:hypothetical protein